MQFTDTLIIDRVRPNADGSLSAFCKIARTGIQIYAGDEVGKPDMDWVRIYRPADEVFHADSLASWAHKPLTNDHPPGPVDPKNWKKYAVGQTGDKVVRDGEFVAVPMIVMDQSAIDDINAGKRELSGGYGCALDWTPGVHDGQEYDAVQRTIRANHVAVVRKARGGSDLRIGDHSTGKGETMTTDLVKFTIDGISIDTTQQGAQALTKLAADVSKLTADAATAATAHATALAAKDAEIADLKGKIVGNDAINAKVIERAGLIAQAKALAPTLDTAALSDADIRKGVVVAKRGADFVKDKGADYIAASYDIIVADAAKGGDQARGAIMNMDTSRTGGGSFTDAAKVEADAHKAMIARMTGAKAA